MHSQINMTVSINYQLKLIGKKYKNEISRIDKATSDDLKLIKTLMCLVQENPSELIGYLLLLPIYYVLNKNYSLAWIIMNYMNDYKRNAFIIKKFESPIILPMSWDLKMYWDAAGEASKISSEERLRRNEEYSAAGKKIPFEPHGGPFKINDPEYNQNQIDRPYGEERQTPYDASPAARYATADGDRNYYLNYTSFLDAINVLPLYFIQEKYPQAAEILFRLQHMVASCAKPKATLEFPSLNRLVPVVWATHCWYMARFSTSPGEQKALAWTAIYWFIEDMLRNVSKANYYSCDMMGPNDSIFAIIGEFDLMADKQPAFLANFKNKAMYASISFCRKMIDDPTPMISFPERHLLTPEECLEIFNEIYPSQ